MDLSKIDMSHRKGAYMEGNTTYFPISLHIDAPAEIVWQVFGKNYGTFLDKVPRFSKVSFKYADGKSPAVGDSRFYTILGLAGEERLKLYDEKNYSLAYDIPVGPPPSMIRNGGNTWSVQEAENGSVFQMKLQGDYTKLGWFMGPLIRRLIQWPTVEAMSYTVKYESEKMYQDSK
jgi:hypothetical protein